MTNSNVQGNLYVISGPSGVGKDTLVARVFSALPELVSSVSVTSRPARSGEVDGVHYFFVDFDNVQKMIDNNELIEWNNYAGNIYGTPRKFVEEGVAEGKKIIFSIDVHGAVNIKKNFTDAKLIFIDAPSEAELRSRLAERGSETQEQIDARMSIYQDELKYRDMFDICIVNDDLEKATNEVIDFIKQSSKMSCSH